MERGMGMRIDKIRENVETLWVTVHHYVFSSRSPRTFHGISYSTMIDIEKALGITVGLLRHIERKHKARCTKDSTSGQAEP